MRDIAAGSLLSVAIHKGVSFPVGKVDTLELNPLSYKEFLKAVGENGLVALIEQQNWDMIKNFKDKYIDWLTNIPLYAIGML